MYIQLYILEHIIVYTHAEYPAIRPPGCAGGR